MRKMLITAIMITFSFIFAQTDGNAVIKFTTATYNGEYKPKHVLAAWITDNSNVFVRSLEVKAKFPDRGRYLTKWLASSQHDVNSNAIPDAITGATQTTHTVHNLTWNLRNFSGTTVPDGTYKVNIEFTESSATGKYYNFSFIKSTTSSSVNPADQMYFKSISLVYTPPTSIENQPEGTDLALKNYPNPFNNDCTIKFTIVNKEQVSLTVYDSKGNVVKTIIRGELGKGEHKAVWEGRDDYGQSVSSGQYYFILKCGNQSEIRKALLLK